MYYIDRHTSVVHFVLEKNSKWNGETVTLPGFLLWGCTFCTFTDCLTQEASITCCFSASQCFLWCQCFLCSDFFSFSLFWYSIKLCCSLFEEGKLHNFKRHVLAFLFFFTAFKVPCNVPQIHFFQQQKTPLIDCKVFLKSL